LFLPFFRFSFSDKKPQGKSIPYSNIVGNVRKYKKLH